MSPTISHAPSPRRGAMAVLIVLVLPLLIVFLGFAVDLAYMQMVRTQLRSVADLAAKAGTAELSRTGKWKEARKAAKEVAAGNRVAGAPLTLRDSEIVFGRSIKQTTGEWEFNEGQTPYNAVRVTAQRTPNSADGAVKLFFGQFYGHGDFTPTTTAVASVIDVDICLVLDRSSSMKLPTSSTATGMSSSDSRFCETPHADSRWVALTDAVQLLLTELGGSIADEKVGLVTFASDYSSCGVSSDKVTCDNWLTTNLSDISSSLTTLNSTLWNGATDIEAGIEKGAEALTDPATSRPLAEKIMIVFTDGAYTAADPVPAATAARNQGIIVYTITFGAGARQADMQAVALAGGGKHYHAPDAGSLNAVFLKIAGSITRLTE